jgi:hypothetical protein
VRPNQVPQLSYRRGQPQSPYASLLSQLAVKRSTHGVLIVQISEVGSWISHALLICSLRKEIHDRCLISVKKRQGDGSPVPVKFHSGRVLTRRHNSCWDYDSKDAGIMAPRTEASTWGRHDKCPKFSRSWITCSSQWSSVTIIKWWLFQHPNYKFLSTLYFLIVVLVST